MCDATGCPADTPPPPGEAWCPARIGVELWRWWTGWPGMTCGPDRDLVPQTHG